ncbi:MAG: hypothetical protein JNJ54_32910 [Myxococcaceae bacterium]|nr:hypothetical protein [Myxococcaceae bacterium]
MGTPTHEWIERMRAAHDRADREEAARVRGMTQAERVEALRAACVTAQHVLAAMTPEARARALAHRDPLPESSVKALRRLREQAARRAEH